MAEKGIVKFYKTVAGYGFIARENGEKDVYFHATSVIASGIPIEKIGAGVTLSFKIGQDKHNRPMAVNLKLVDMMETSSTSARLTPPGYYTSTDVEEPDERYPAKPKKRRGTGPLAEFGSLRA